MNHSMDDYTVRTSNYILHFSGLFCAMYRANRGVKSNVSQKDIKLPMAPITYFFILLNLKYDPFL